MNEQAWKEQAARVLCGADSCWDYDTLPEQRSEISATEDSFCKDYWRKLAAALYPIVQQAIAAERGEPVSSMEFHQKRGMLADVISAALLEYDEWMKDDDYNARGCLDRVIAQLERARDIVPDPAPTEAQIRADERERCAKVAEDWNIDWARPSGYMPDDIAAAIRSLKEADNHA